jgi:hypothetical protein
MLESKQKLKGIIRKKLAAAFEAKDHVNVEQGQRILLAF